MVVATPGRLGEHIKAGNLRLDQCRAVVLDEVDVLLGDTFAFAQQVRQGHPTISVVEEFLASNGLGISLAGMSDRCPWTYDRSSH